MTAASSRVLCLLLLTGCASHLKSAAPEASPPTLEPVATNVWVHQSYAYVPPWGDVLSQGLVVKDGEHVYLVDSAWTDEDTALLLTQIEKVAGAPVSTAVVTHAHSDKMGGMSTLDARGVTTFALPETNEDAPARELLPAQRTVSEDERLGPLEIFHPGPGHTRDNIVVYHSASKILFGGCLIRPAAATDLGNTADGDVRRWADSVRAVAARFPEATVVIPSHGAAGGRELLDHTIALAEAAEAP